MSLGGASLKGGGSEARRRIELVFKDPDDQLFNPKVYDEIAFALRQTPSSREEVNEKIHETAERFGLQESSRKWRRRSWMRGIRERPSW